MGMKFSSIVTRRNKSKYKKKRRKNSDKIRISSKKKFLPIYFVKKKKKFLDPDPRSFRFLTGKNRLAFLYGAINTSGLIIG